MTKAMEGKKDSSSNDCFIIMPVADPEGYEGGHFRKVYEDIFKPACIEAGYNPIRADDVTQTNLIHLDILQKLIDSPLAICDLSSRNPNVLFELGLRQAFDKPTVLVQEVGTPKIFDIAPLRYTEYRRALRYREVIEDQRSIEKALTSTIAASKNGDGVNSIVRILSLSGPASLKQTDTNDASALLQLVRAEMSEMRHDFRGAMSVFDIDRKRQVSADWDKGAIDSSRRLREANALLDEAEALSLKTNIPAPILQRRVNQAQSILAGLLKSDITMKRSFEMRSAFDRASDLESKLSSLENQAGIPDGKVWRLGEEE